MELFDFQTTVTVVLILTATAMVVLFDYMRKQRRRQPPLQPQLVKTPAASSRGSKLTRTSRPSQPTRLFEAAPIDYAAAKKLAQQRPLEPLVGAPTAPARADECPGKCSSECSAACSPENSMRPLVPVATSSRPDVAPRIERDVVTVAMAPNSPSAPSSPATTSLQTFSLPEFTIDAALWERLIASQPRHNLLPSADDDRPRFQDPPARELPARDLPARDLPAHDLLAIDQPHGMIQPTVLDKWLESESQFTGLVVSIGINESDSSMWHSKGLVQSVGSYIASLLKAKDYCCRTSYDEFLIVCPGEQGAQSQRRLNHISERLWDYQLRGIGAVSILFSWGGVQVENRPLAEAVASAADRMRETKRGTPTLSQRQAV
jgi:hypothetical protein